MKKKSKTRTGTIIVFLFFFLAIAAISSVESLLFYGKFKDIDMFEDLHNRVNHISRIVARLGYTFDLVVVGGRLEQTTVNIFHKDVDRIDEEINDMMNIYSTEAFASSNKVLAEDLKGVPSEWRKIYNDIKSLSVDMDHDKLLLIHNDIDIDVIVMDERIDRISLGINAALQKVLRKFKILLLVTLGAFIIMLIAASLFLYSRFISPLKTLENDALDMVSGGSIKTGFVDSMDGIVGSLANKLNTILEEKTEKSMALEETISGLQSALNDKQRAIKALEAFFSNAGRTFESEPLFEDVVLKAKESTGACRVLLYIFEKGKLTLKAWTPPDEAAAVGASILPEEAMGDGSGELLEITMSSKGVYHETIHSEGIKWLRSFAVGPKGESDYGRLIFLFQKKPENESVEFAGALASAMGTSISFVQRLKEEHEQRKDCFTILNQLPFAVAVFDKDGACILVNLLLKKFFGSAPDFDFQKDYTFTDDDVLSNQGLVTTIKKSYDGFITEFIINYDPYLVKRYGFMGEARDLRVKSLPLYEPEGTISKIALLFEDITEHDEPEPPEDRESP